MLILGFLLTSFVGFLDSTYLTARHYFGIPLNCPLLEDCEKVTTSQYATLGNVPVALLGTIYYLLIFLSVVLYLDTKRGGFLQFASYSTVIGFLASLWFLYLQFFVIKAICFYCLVSVATSTLLFLLGLVFLTKKKAFLEYNIPMQKFRLLTHLVTSDVAFEAFGKTPSELFENAAVATFSVMCDLKKVKAKTEKTLKLKAPTLEDLLFDFLNELLFLKDRDSILFSKFLVTIHLNDLNHLSAEISGERIKPLKHKLGVDVKAVTKHKFKIKKEKKIYKATVVLDI